MDMPQFMAMQRSLQIKMKEVNPELGGDPFRMSPDELAQFVTWNHSALIVELGEMMKEVGWKPWASSRHCNAKAALQEMVDAFHFFLNIMLALAAWDGLYTADEAAEFFEQYYVKKNIQNLERQKEGYDGVSTKCPNPGCGRELSDSNTRISLGGSPVYCQHSCYISGEAKRELREGEKNG